MILTNIWQTYVNNITEYKEKMRKLSLFLAFFISTSNPSEKKNIKLKI